MENQTHTSAHLGKRTLIYESEMVRVYQVWDIGGHSRVFVSEPKIQGYVPTVAVRE